MNVKLVFPGATSLLVTLALGSGQASAQNLLVDGNFDSPVVTTGGYQSGNVIYNPGNTFGGPGGTAWTVVGSGGNVAVTNATEYTGGSPKAYYNSYGLDPAGNPQYLDLSGSTDDGAPVGVRQDVATTIGGMYTLSFALGAFSGQPVAISLTINGSLVGTYSASGAFTPSSYNGDGVTAVGYNTFSLAYTATSATTSIVFGNLSPFGSSDVALDQVSFARQAVAVPGPIAGAGIPALLAVGGALWTRRRKILAA